MPMRYLHLHTVFSCIYIFKVMSSFSQTFKKLKIQKLIAGELY